MAILVEPLEGAELDRLITALLNATGAVHQVVGRGIAAGGEGVEVIGRSAERLRAILAVVAEHHGDEELRVITEFLAIATLLIAEEEGFAAAFRPDDDDRDDPDDLHADWV
ncbi:MAG: hypothetical protein BroJett022_21480 [Actinomycetes bacterium]|nr:MAG: hypothetical protein BroJett022_21480 [Actinomycetes bacterium]